MILKAAISRRPSSRAKLTKTSCNSSPVRQAARVGATSSGSVIVPRRTGRPTAAWVGETETRSATESAYGQVEIPIDEIACYVDVSNKLLEDAAVDVAAEVAFDLAEEFGRAEGEAFISGNGVKKPLGLLNDTGLSFTVSGTAAVIADADGGANGLIDLFYALAPFYRQRGVFMANGKTIAALRKLKDGQKQYLWQPSIAVGTAGNVSRPSDRRGGGPARHRRGHVPVLFGDFASAFRIYDRITLSLLRDPYRRRPRAHALPCSAPGRRSRRAARSGSETQDQRVIGGNHNARLRTQHPGQAGAEPGRHAADNTAQVGEIIDRFGYDSLTYVIATGAIPDADATFAVLLEESDAANMAGANAVADADMISQLRALRPRPRPASSSMTITRSASSATSATSATRG